MMMNNENRPLILASASPRRRQLLQQTAIPFTVIPCRQAEVMETDLPLAQAVSQLACQKAAWVLKDNPQALVLGADTIVTIDGQMLGKPADESQARQMIAQLAGRTHTVITGCAITAAGYQDIFYDEAAVTFAPIRADAIESYVKTAEPYDKAGGYAIQGWAGLYITRIEGSYDTVMGLPLALVYQRLQKLGY